MEELEEVAALFQATDVVNATGIWVAYLMMSYNEVAKLDAGWDAHISSMGLSAEEQASLVSSLSAAVGTARFWELALVEGEGMLDDGLVKAMLYSHSVGVAMITGLSTCRSS